MSLKITGVKNHATDLNSEQVEIEVLANTNLDGYALVDNTYRDGKPSNVHPHFYHLPNVEVITGDKIIVHTGTNINYSPRRLQGQNITHHLYIGSDKFIWNNTGDIAWLFKVELTSRMATN